LRYNSSMSDVQAQLVPPLLLLAMPQVQDPFFHRSVVLLMQHDEQGSLGFIVNRKTGSSVAEVLEGMGIQWGGEGKLAVHFGGPVHPHLGTILFDVGETGGTRKEQGGTEVGGLPGVRFTRDLADLQKLAGEPPASFRLFLGCAGWGPGQLLEEILRNDWLISPLRKDLLFSADPDGAWAMALHGVGVNPEALPTWTPGDEQGPVA
jgi:putative transcriptional regulator